MEQGNFKERGERAKSGVDEKICPFMSDSLNLVPCNPRCKLYRSNKGAYTCYFMEMQAISYNTRKVI